LALSSGNHAEGGEVAVAVGHCLRVDLVDSLSHDGLSLRNLGFLAKIQQKQVSELVSRKDVVLVVVEALRNAGDSVELKGTLRRQCSQGAFVVRVLLMLLDFEDLAVDVLQDGRLERLIDESVGLRQLV